VSVNVHFRVTFNNRHNAQNVHKIVFHVRPQSTALSATINSTYYKVHAHQHVLSTTQSSQTDNANSAQMCVSHVQHQKIIAHRVKLGTLSIYTPVYKYVHWDTTRM